MASRSWASAASDEPIVTAHTADGSRTSLRARNVSMTGALLATEKRVLDRFPTGTERAASVFISEDPSERVAIRARVVRHEDNALVIDWFEDVEASFRIALFISTLPS
jgi:hypothetical protein